MDTFARTAVGCTLLQNDVSVDESVATALVTQKNAKRPVLSNAVENEQTNLRA